MAVPDTGPAIQQAVREALSRAEVVIATGGLGPTSDDRTRDLVAELLGRKLEMNEAVRLDIKNYFSKRSRPQPARTEVQALVPEGALVLPNAFGTAPGLAIAVPAGQFRAGDSNSWLIMLPGPPRELQPMFDDQVVPLAGFFRERGHTLRFIEYMDVGHTNGWRLDDVVPAKEIVAQLDEAFGVEPAEAHYRGEVAQRWRYKDGVGEVGVIASVTQPFCGDCTRARISAEGKLFTCLFAVRGHDLRALIRGGASDEELEAAVRTVWGGRADRYSDLRSAATTGLDKVEMSYIGG